MRVTVFDEELLFAEAFSYLFARHGHELVGCPSSLDELLTTVSESDADVCVLCLSGGELLPSDLLRSIHETRPSLALVVLAEEAEECPFVENADNNLDGICIKTDGIGEVEHVLLKAIQSRQSATAQGRTVWSVGATALARERRGTRSPTALTPKEKLVLELLIAGASTSEIAAQVGVRVATVRTHLQHLFEKLGVHSRLALIAKAVRYDLVNLDEERRLVAQR